MVGRGILADRFLADNQTRNRLSMRLPSEFIRLPLMFDAERLATEANQFAESDWDSHPQNYAGNSALILVSANGGRNNAYTGKMAPTTLLTRCPYIQQVLATFATVIGRTRLMRLEPGTQVPPHCDTDYSWRHRVRIHVPIITDDKVRFSSIGNIDVNMKPGEAWIFDNWKSHAVYNDGNTRRIHLVIDTTGSANFWKLADLGQDPRNPVAGWQDSLRRISFDADGEHPVQVEQFNQMAVATPDEVDSLVGELVDDLGSFQATHAESHAGFCDAAVNFRRDWRCHWSLYGDSARGLPHYENLARDFKAQGSNLLQDATFESNQTSAAEVLGKWLDATTDARVVREREQAASSGAANIAMFDRPVFIVAAPRSGSTMLFELLSQNQEFWTIGDESHAEFESIRALHPATKNFSSNALNESDATSEVIATLAAAFIRKLKNSRGTLFAEIPAQTQASQIRFLEKTPKNALRIPFLKAMFPNALFIFLHRQAPQNIGSIIDAWQSGNFVTYPRLPRWQGPPWSLLLPAGWRDLNNKSIGEIATWQWQVTNETILSDLARLPANDWFAVSYEDIVDNKAVTLQRLCDFVDVPFGPRMRALATEAQPHSRYTLTPPDPDKWQRHRDQIESHLSALRDTQARLAQLRNP